MAKKDICTRCSKQAYPRYTAMESWNIKGVLCSECYSKLIGEHYEGAHTRIN